MLARIWSVVAVLAFWCWVVAMLAFIFRAFPKEQPFDGRQAVKWGALVVVSALLWWLGLSRC